MLTPFRRRWFYGNCFQALTSPAAAVNSGIACLSHHPAGADLSFLRADVNQKTLRGVARTEAFAAPHCRFHGPAQNAGSGTTLFSQPAKCLRAKKEERRHAAPLLRLERLTARQRITGN
jgi:hypothetical protein